MRIYADPGPGQTLPAQKVVFSHEKYTLHKGCGRQIRTVFGVKLLSKQRVIEMFVGTH